MLKLTAEQITSLRNSMIHTGCTTQYDIEAVISGYHAILNASPTHRVVEAPEGYEFNLSIANMLATRLDYPFIQVAIRPIPKPCPAPKLEPVTVTVEEVYGKYFPAAKELAVNCLAEFGRIDRMTEAGFTAAITENSPEIWPIDHFRPNVHRIGLRKWEGK